MGWGGSVSGQEVRGGVGNSYSQTTQSPVNFKLTQVVYINYLSTLAGDLNKANKIPARITLDEDSSETLIMKIAFVNRFCLSLGDNF